MNNSIEILERAVERATGQKASALRERTLDQTRRIANRHGGRKSEFLSQFPFIGRGNVLRDRIATHEQVEAWLDAAIKSK